MREISDALRRCYGRPDHSTGGALTLAAVVLPIALACLTSGSRPAHAMVPPIAWSHDARRTADGSHRDVASDSSGTLAGVVVGGEQGEVVPYGTVLLVGTGLARFTDAKGNFRITRLAPGVYTVRARQIGYAPRDTMVQVDPSPAVTTITIRLTRLPAILGLVQVEGQRSKECRATGIPDSTVDPKLAAVFTQLRENVDRFRLLLDAYPFRSSREELGFVRLEPGGDSLETADTTAYESRDQRPYRVGGVVFEDSDSSTISTHRRCYDRGAANICATAVAGKPARRRQLMYIPTFSDLTDSAFLASHCFAYGGTESLRTTGSLMIRIDFRPAVAITAPDIRGTIYLDASRLIVRRAVFRLTKPERVDPPVKEFVVRTTFVELVPLVPVVDSVESEQPLPGRDVAQGLAGQSVQRIDRVAVARDHLLAVTFEGQPPGAATPPPTAASPTSPAPASRPTPLLAGRVIAADGTPVQGAVLSLMGMADTLATSDSGRFVFPQVRAGAYMLWVRRIGFREVRMPVTVSAQRPRDVTITLRRLVPRLPTVTTTGQIRDAYHDVGLDQRMRAGIGQFVTYDQIVRREATQVTQLLTSIRGLVVGQQHELGDGSQHVGSNNTVVPTRGGNTCMQYSIDGVPQPQLGERDIDNLIHPSAVGAIEVYTLSERPAGFGGASIIAPSGCDDVVLVAIWTRTRLGLSGTTPADSANTADVIHGVPVFGPDAACEPAPTPDTIQLVLRATLQSAARVSGTDTAYSRYEERVLEAVRRSFVLPTELSLRAFGSPFAVQVATGPLSAGPSIDIAPAVSSVVVFMLDSAGSLRSARLAASSLSGSADTTVLAAIERAADAQAFPVLAPGVASQQGSRFDLIMSTDPPTPGERSVPLGRIEVPVWPLKRRASLVTEPPPSPADNASQPVRRDSLPIEFVVDEGGRAVRSTVRGISQDVRSAGVGHTAADIMRTVDALGQIRFAPALIGACPVAQVIRQSLPLP